MDTPLDAATSPATPVAAPAAVCEPHLLTLFCTGCLTRRQPSDFTPALGHRCRDCVNSRRHTRRRVRKTSVAKRLLDNIRTTARRNQWPAPAMSVLDIELALARCNGRSALSGQELQLAPVVASNKATGDDHSQDGGSDNEKTKPRLPALVPRNTSRALSWPDNCLIITQGESRYWKRTWQHCLRAAEAAEAPAAQEPTAEAPTAQEPTAEAPTAQEPTAEAPAAQEPTAEAPAAESVDAVDAAADTGSDEELAIAPMALCVSECGTRD